jgi:hypothetical protein
VCSVCRETVPDQPYCDRCGIRVDAIDEALFKRWRPPWMSAADDYQDWLSACPF